MSGKADYTEEEWKQLLRRPRAPECSSSRPDGGSVRESFSMAKAYTEARKQPRSERAAGRGHLDKPEVDRTRSGSGEELREQSLQTFATR